jgi:hypothetical protein
LQPVVDGQAKPNVQLKNRVKTLKLTPIL